MKLYKIVERSCGSLITVDYNKCEIDTIKGMHCNICNIDHMWLVDEDGTIIDEGVESQVKVGDLIIKFYDVYSLDDTADLVILSKDNLFTKTIVSRMERIDDIKKDIWPDTVKECVNSKDIN